MTDIITDNCIIKRCATEYIEPAVLLFTDSQVRKYLGGPVPAEWARHRLEQWCDPQSENIYFAITLHDGTFIGIIDIAPYHDGTSKELSYMFLPAYWGQGYAFESVKAVLDFCQKHLKLVRIVSETQTKNERSCALLERMGYKLHGQLIRFDAEQNVYVFDISAE